MEETKTRGRKPATDDAAVLEAVREVLSETPDAKQSAVIKALRLKGLSVSRERAAVAFAEAKAS